MDTLSHFVFAFVAGLAVNVKLRHRVPTIGVLAFLSVLIDVDHFFFTYPRAFHTVFIAVVLPLALFYGAYRYEKSSGKIRLQSMSLLLFVMLTSHVITDAITGGVKPFYPVSDVVYTFPAVELTFAQENWPVVTGQGIALTVYAAVIGLAYYTEQFIYFFERQHETASEALTDLFRNG